MSDTDTDSLVMVDTYPEDIADLMSEDEKTRSPSSAAMTDTPPRALQIVSIDPQGDHAFAFDKAKLQIVLDKIPPSYKVAVVSVVGAFRTGKSFLLSWFLRYLSSQSGDDDGDFDEKWYDQFQSLGNDGFDWRAGSERNTTGIWVWSHPHILKRAGQEPLAVLLVDTQGMFDHETNMALTASIFGFSTLLSSYQIYNVDKRIQEDNLQHLALFSEYARTAVTQEEKDNEQSVDAGEGNKKKPFQHIEFLVRDWQHFEQDEDDDDIKDYDAMEASMESYLDTVLSIRDDKDLKDTREQITSCFQDISCFGLVHPGFAVTKKKFTGNVKDIELDFVALLDRYCVRVFEKAVEPKVIHGRELTAIELGTYVEAYAKLFVSGATFPEAATMLEATAAANNTNAVHLGQAKYKEMMDRVSGPKCSNYLKPEELDDEHKQALKASLEVFDSIANFGSNSSIDKAKTVLLEHIEGDLKVYTALNEGRNPLAGLETYIIPILLGLFSYIVRWLTDLTCSASVCKASSEVLSHTYAVVWSFLFIIALTKFKHIKDTAGRLGKALEILMDTQTSKKSDKPKND